VLYKNHKKQKRLINSQYKTNKMKLLITLVLLSSSSIAFSQWRRVEQLPSSDIGSLYHKDNVLYAGGKNIVYISKNNGRTWDSTSNIPQLFLVTSVIVYKNELYAAAPNKGVFKSNDEGITWLNISASIFPDVSDFCEFRGNLYASTFGNSVYQLDSINKDNWQFFSSGLSNFSANIPSIASNNNAMIAGTLNNGIYDHLPANSTTWEERLLTGQISPNEGAYDIITGHDTIFFAGRTGRYFMSTDNGLSWNLFSNRLISAATTFVNAKQALISSTHIFNGTNFISSFYYIKKNALQEPFINFSVITDHFTYKIDILGNKLWEASNKGLFFMSLSDLPGISAADDTVAAPVPVRFISFNVNCEANSNLLSWKTAQEQNSSHFNIERSTDGILWSVIGNLNAAGNSNTESSYSFKDFNPIQNCFYRIAENDIDGRIQFSNILRSSCSTAEVFSVWPNPVQDLLFINVVTNSKSQVIIKLSDAKSALVKTQKAFILPGSNQVGLDMKSLPRGVYTLYVNSNDGQMTKIIQVLKQ
jgi:hypothetical protein